MNLGCEDDELKPYIEPPKDVRDEKLIQHLRSLGYNNQAISDALERERFEEIHATYLMLKASRSDVEASLPFSSAQPISDTSVLSQSNTGQPNSISAGVRFANFLNLFRRSLLRISKPIL